ncbi:MAG: hypothetical protein Q4F18_10045, partial [Clostridia bacterium]|nr:hypothetical protein [Clostridia bacterium]
LPLPKIAANPPVMANAPNFYAIPLRPMAASTPDHRCKSPGNGERIQFLRNSLFQRHGGRSFHRNHRGVRHVSKRVSHPIQIFLILANQEVVTYGKRTKRRALQTVPAMRPGRRTDAPETGKPAKRLHPALRSCPDPENGKTPVSAGMLPTDRKRSAHLFRWHPQTAIQEHLAAA